MPKAIMFMTATIRLASALALANIVPSAAQTPNGRAIQPNARRATTQTVRSPQAGTRNAQFRGARAQVGQDNAGPRATNTANDTSTTGQQGQCYVETDPEHGYGYQGDCKEPHARQSR
jgi:hypothetical protein